MRFKKFRTLDGGNIVVDMAAVDAVESMNDPDLSNLVELSLSSGVRRQFLFDAPEGVSNEDYFAKILDDWKRTRVRLGHQDISLF
jgi:hypothetical protein